MKIHHFLSLLLGTLILLASGCTEKKVVVDEISLWPEIEPFDSGYLRVSDIHEIYYELCGNPDGIPVFVLHGGPGAGCSPYMRKFFNPEKYLVILHDQRGCGRSRPLADLRDNTTQALVQDIEQIRGHLGIDRFILFGGSWGSTLSLAYAEAYPANITAMVLRGVYLVTKEENASIYPNLRNYYPEEFHDLLDLLPDSISAYNISDSLLNLLIKSDKKLCDVLTRMNFKAQGLIVDNNEMDAFLSSPDNAEFISTMNTIFYHYMANFCFLEENQLLKNAQKIKDVPLTIVNGRYDMMCPPLYAFKLHRAIPGSMLIITEKAGHSMTEETTEKELLKAMIKLETLYDE